MFVSANVCERTRACMCPGQSSKVKMTVRCNKKTPQGDSVNKIRSVCRPGMMLDATFVGSSRPYHAHLSFEKKISICFVLFHVCNFAM